MSTIVKKETYEFDDKQFPSLGKVKIYIENELGWLVETMIKNMPVACKKGIDVVQDKRLQKLTYDSLIMYRDSIYRYLDATVTLGTPQHPSEHSVFDVDQNFKYLDGKSQESSVIIDYRFRFGMHEFYRLDELITMLKYNISYLLFAEAYSACLDPDTVGYNFAANFMITNRQRVVKLLSAEFETDEGYFKSIFEV